MDFWQMAKTSVDSAILLNCEQVNCAIFDSYFFISSFDSINGVTLSTFILSVNSTFDTHIYYVR